METETEQRSAEELIDKGVPYADMTEAELASVIELKASWKARDLAHSEAAQQRSEAMQKVVDTAQQAAEESRQTLDRLVSMAMKEYEATLGGGDEQEEQATEA